MSGLPGARLLLDSRLEETRRIGSWLDDQAPDASASERRRAELAAVELVTNAIRHAFGGQRGNAITLRLQLSPQALTLTIEHGGTAPPASAFPSSMDEAVNSRAELPEHGMGLRLVYAVADSCRVEQDGDRALFELKFSPGEGQ